MSAAADIRIVERSLPVSLDDPDATTFFAASEMWRGSEGEGSGADPFDRPVEDIFRRAKTTVDHRSTRFDAFLHDRLIGGALPRDAFLPSYAAAPQRMDTDQLFGNAQIEAETITVERLRRNEHRAVDAGQTTAVTAATHRPTGDTAAFNEISITSDQHSISQTGRRS